MYCHLKHFQTLLSRRRSLETRAVDCSADRTKLAQIESEVHMLEKALDSADLAVGLSAPRFGGLLSQCI